MSEAKPGRGRPRKAQTHVVIVPAPDGGFRLVTKPGPAPKRPRGAPNGPRVSKMLKAAAFTGKTAAAEVSRLFRPPALKPRELQSMRTGERRYYIAAAVYWLHKHENKDVRTACDLVALGGVAVGDRVIVRPLATSSHSVRRAWNEFSHCDFSGIIREKKMRPG
jgi:hypothetical protein